MSISTYVPAMFRGLLDPKHKSHALERLTLANPSWASTGAPIGIAAYKNTPSFKLAHLDGSSSYIVDLSRFSEIRRPAILDKCVLFAAQPRRDGEAISLHSYNFTSEKLISVEGILGEIQSIVALPKKSGASSDCVAIGSADLFHIIESDLNGKNSTVTKLKLDNFKPIHRVRNAVVCSNDSDSFLLYSQHEIQLWKLSKERDAATLSFTETVQGLGIVHARFCANVVVAATDSGQTLLKWHLSTSVSGINKPEILETKNPVTSISLDEEYIILGHPAGRVTVHRTSDLSLFAEFSTEEPSLSDEKSDSSNQNTRANIFDSLQNLVLTVERHGDYIFGCTDNSICIWSLDLKKIPTPIKFRRTAGKIVASMQIQHAPSSITLYAPVARSLAAQEASESESPQVISPKDLRIDSFMWKIPTESLAKASKRRLAESEYQQSLSSLLSRDISNTLMKDVGFAHRFIFSTRAARVNVNLAHAVLDVSALLKRTPTYLTASIVEYMSLIESYRKGVVTIFNMFEMQMPSNPANFLVRGNAFPIQVIIAFLRKEGLPFVKSIWSPLLRKFRRKSDHIWETNYRTIYLEKRQSGMSREQKRQIRAEAKEEARTNEAKIEEWAEMFLIASITSSKEIPSSIVDILRVFYLVSHAAFPEESAEAIVKGGPLLLFFHELLVAALAAPTLFGLIGSINVATQTNLGQVARTVAHAVFGKLDDPEHRLRIYEQKACEFIEAVCDVKASTNKNSKNKKKGTANVDHAVVQAKPKFFKAEAASSPFVAKDYYSIAEYVVNHASSLSDIADEGNYALEAETSILLQAIAKQDKIKKKSREEECTVFCIKNEEEEGHDVVDPSKLQFFSESFTMQEGKSSKHSDLRSLSNEDIPFSNLLAANPRDHPSLRDWVSEEYKNRSFLILIFFRGAWCPFCSSYQRGWSKYMNSIIKRDGLIVGVSSMTQVSSKKTATEWGLSYPLLGDPRNELASMFGVEVDKHPSYKYGMSQPALVVLSRSGEMLYFWKSTSLLGTAFGALDRPRQYNVLTSVLASLKQAAPSVRTSIDDEITRQSTMASLVTRRQDTQDDSIVYSTAVEDESN